MRTEAAVVGAGPAGLIAARELARRGVEVKVFEEHPVIGEPSHCSGILSVEGLRRLGVEHDYRFIRHEIRGGTAYSPNGAGIRITGGRTRAYVVDRPQFDRHLAEKALDSGAEIETNYRVKELLVKGGGVSGVRGEADVEAKVIIDAEGAAGALARRVGLPRPEEGVLAGLNVDVTDVDPEPYMAEVWLGDCLAPGLFAWVAPTVEGEARCGLACSRGDAHALLRDFLDRRFGLKEYGKPTRWLVLTGGPIERTYSDGLLLVGDVAGQTKPTTGGGVIIGGLCAIEAARTACEALEEGDTSSEFLSRYEDKWRGALGGEFSSMLGARRFLNGISDDRMDQIFSSLKGAGLESTLERFIDEGDMDMQSGVLRSALTHPGLLKVLAGSLGRLALGELKDFFNL